MYTLLRAHHPTCVLKDWMKFISKRLFSEEMQTVIWLRGLKIFPYLPLLHLLQNSLLSHRWVDNLFQEHDCVCWSFLRKPILYYPALWISCKAFCGIFWKQKRALTCKLLLLSIRNIWIWWFLVIQDLGGIL